MGLSRWLAGSGASTLDRTHPDLAPLVVPMPPELAALLVRKAVATLPGWRIVSDTPETFEFACGSQILGNTMIVTYKSAGPGTMIHAVSRSRVGFCRSGPNRRKILELFAAIRRSSQVIEEQ